MNALLVARLLRPGLPEEPRTATNALPTAAKGGIPMERTYVLPTSPSPAPTPTARPECPVWCAHPHSEDEPHYGPCADVEALSAKGEPLMVALDCGQDGKETVTLATQTPEWRLPVGEAVVFALDQVVVLRDVIDEFLTTTGHPAARQAPSH